MCLFLFLFSLIQINLRLILVSGKTKEFLFSPSDSAGDIAQTVFDNWPEGKFHFRATNKLHFTIDNQFSTIVDEFDHSNFRIQMFALIFNLVLLFLFSPLSSIDWAAEAVPKAEVLRLIYQGRFLHCNVTLGALVLPLGKTTVMHLVPRDNLPEPNSQGNCFEHVLLCCNVHLSH